MINKWNYINYCPTCKSKDIDCYANTDYMDTILCEYDVKCRNCDNIISHYAYGQHEWDRTRTGYINMIWNCYKMRGFTAIKEIMWILFLRRD